MSANPTAPLPLDDADIKSLAARDPRAAMALVVHRHRPRLLRHAQGIVRDPDVACDVVQEVFIKAMREPRLFEEEFRIGAWLYRVTANLCLNTVRDSRRRTDILAGLQLRGDVDAGQMEAVLGEQREAQVAHAMQNLSANHRKILQERFYQDRSYTEIAETLDIKLGTVMSRLSRAKAALVDLMDTALVAEL